jgi:hypothetical protein
VANHPIDVVDCSSREATDPFSQQTLQTVSEFLRSVVPSGEGLVPLPTAFGLLKKPPSIITMSIQPPQGILTIPNATLRVGRLQVDEVEGFDTVLNTFDKNTILEEDSEVYDDDKKWGVKMPNIFVATFEIKGAGSSFNFRNTSMGDAGVGYTLTFSGTTLTLKYNGSQLGVPTTIPNLNSTYGKVYLTYEKQYFTVTVDGTQVLSYKDTVTRNPPDGEYINFFAGGDGGFKNLKVVAGHLISDGTSNVSLYGGLAVTSNLEVGSSNLFVDTVNSRVGVGTTTPEATLHVSGNAYVSSNLEVGSSNLFVDTVNSRVGVGTDTPKESLDVVGNMHLTRVSNVSQIKVDSNVVTEYTGPHDRPLRKYPEVAILGGQSGLSGGYTQDGYTVEASSEFSAIHAASNVFNHIQAYQTTDHAWLSGTNTYGLTDGLASSGTSKDTFQDVDGSWLGITLPTGIRLSHIHIYNRFDNANSVRPPKTGIIWASNDGTSWYNIFNFDNLQDTDGTLNVLHVNNTNFYTRYRVQITAMHNDPQKTSVAVGELEFYGHEEGSGSLDTTLKSVYNVPATTGTQLEVYYDAKDLTTMPSAVTDLSPNTNDGSVSGDPQVSNGAFVFDGSGDYFSSTVTTTTGAGNWPHSYSFWMKADTDASSDAHFVALGTEGDSTSVIRFSGENIRWYFWSNDVTFKASNLRGRWVHIVGTYDGGAVDTSRKIFINNVEAPISSISGTIGSLNLTTTSTPFKVGSQLSNINTFKGSIANFRLYSKALNAGQVQELYDYQKDYFLGSKSQVTLYKGHLGVGVTEPSGQLELAGDERIQEYPPGPMDGYETLIPGHGVFCATAENEYSSTLRGYKAFNKQPTGNNERWRTLNNQYSSNVSVAGNRLSTETPLGSWLKLKCPYKVNITGYIVDPQSGQAPEYVELWGSNDDTNWSFLDGQSHPYPPDNFQTYTFQVSHTGHYKYIAFIPVRSYGTEISIRELRYFGTPGPTTLDKGSLTLGRSLDVPRVSRYDVDTETPRPEKLVVDFDTTVNSSPTDISGRGNDGTFDGTNMNYSSADKAFVFNGTDDYINMTRVSGIRDSNPFTVSFWVNVDVNTGERCFMQYGAESTNDSIGIKLNDSYDEIEFFFYSNDIRFTWTPDVHRWYHVVARYDGGTDSGVTSGQIGVSRKIWVDGVELLVAPGARATSGTITSPSLPANSDLHIGVRINSGGYIDGQISNFKLYNVALEPSEVKKLYNLGRTGRSMVISDTAVGIGKVPEAQLDVRGVVSIDNIIPRGYLQLNQGIRPADSSATHGMRWTNTDNANHWHLFNSDNDHFRFVYNGAAKGWVDPNDPNAQMNFTGQHRTFIKDVPFSQVGELEGLIVSSDQNKYIKMSGGIEVGSNAITTNESLPVVSLSNVVTDKKCFGVISASEDPEKREEMYGNFGSVFEKEKGDTRVYINSVGEGAIWVTDINGSLESGDYITTSNVAGYGQKQDGAGLMNYTVAKITMDCDFEPVTQSVQIIKKDEHGENVLDVHGQIQWGDDPSGATEKAYKIRYLDANGNITDEANHVHKAAFVGCTYHCG